jgi:hypothetical protein
MAVAASAMRTGGLESWRRACRDSRMFIASTPIIVTAIGRTGRCTGIRPQDTCIHR